MTNNKQQTAVEWQFEQLFNSFEKFNNSEYTFDEYLKRNLEIREQAKEMEKEQHEATALAMIEYALDNIEGKNNLNGKDAFEQYYKLTYGGVNQ